MKPRNKIQPLPFVLPALFVYILTVIIPILWSMGYSLFSWNGIGDMKFIGLENYVRMFQDETFREAVVNNLKFVVLGSLFQLCAGLILAILLTHISKGGNILRVIYFIPCIISSMAICQIFSKMLSVQPQGLVCYVMEKLGMEPIALLANSHTALITITLIDAERQEIGSQPEKQKEQYPAFYDLMCAKPQKALEPRQLPPSDRKPSQTASRVID